MGFGYTNLTNGLRIVAKAVSANATLGDLEVLTGTNQLFFYNGTTNTALVSENGTETLSNKTISGSTNTITNIGDSSLVVSYLKADGTRALTSSWNAGAFTITANSVQLGSAANTIAGVSVLTNGSGSFDLNSTGTITVPNATDTLVTLALSQTLTNKTLTAPVIATIVNGGTLTLPTSTDTLVGRATTDTLTNKTLTSPVINTPTLDVETLIEQSSTPSNPSAGDIKLYFKTNGNLYSLNSSGTETQLSSGSGAVNATSPRFTLSGATVPFICIDGTYYVQATNSIAAVYITMLDSGNSGNTTIQLNQYRSGTLQNSATASLAASGDNPSGANASLSGTLSVISGDILTVDVVSQAVGTPSELSVQPIFS